MSTVDRLQQRLVEKSTKLRSCCNKEPCRTCKNIQRGAGIAVAHLRPVLEALEEFADATEARDAAIARKCRAQTAYQNLCADNLRKAIRGALNG